MQKASNALRVLPLAALIALVACGEPEPEVVGGMADPDADAIEEMEPAELPPMRVREASFRCADNSIVYVNFYTNDTQVGVSTEAEGVETILQNDAASAEGEEAAPSDGPPSYSGEGYRLIGAADASTIQFARPGGSLQSCNA